MTPGGTGSRQSARPTGLAIAALAVAIVLTSRARAVAAADCAAITSGPVVWTSPVVAADGEILAVAHDAEGAHLERISPGREPLAWNGAHGTILQIAIGSSSASPVVIRADAAGVDNEESDSLIRLADTPSGDVPLLHAGLGERLADPAISPDGRWIALVVRREPRAKDRALSTQLVLVPSAGGIATVVEQGEGDRLGPSFVEGGKALWFVRREGEYSLLMRVPLETDGEPADAPAVLQRDRARWGRPLSIDSSGSRALVARDSGNGPSLWQIEVGTWRSTPAGGCRAAPLEPALTADSRELIAVASTAGGRNLFRSALDPKATETLGATPEAHDDDGPRIQDEGRPDRERFDEARARTANRPCLACHDHERGLDVIGASVHGKLACTDCHVDVTETPHRSLARAERVARGPDERGRPVDSSGRPRAAVGFDLRGVSRAVTTITAASVACGSCHPRQARAWQTDVHGRDFPANAAVPGCATCHGDHDVLPEHDPRSPVATARIADTCAASCHEGAWEVRHSYLGVRPADAQYRSDPGSTYRDSIHAKKVRLGEEHAATCASCHGAHRVLTARDPRSTLNPQNAAKTCSRKGACHSDASADFAKLFDHVIAVSSGETVSASAMSQGKTPRGYAELAFSVIGGGTLAWAGADLVLDALRRVVAGRKRKKASS